MKRIILSIIIVLMLFVLTGCSKVKNCNGCVYTRYYEPKLIKETLKDYKKDYTSIKNKVFLGHKLDKNNNIIKSYICGIDKNEVFCLEGNNNGSKYKENKRILTKLYGKNKCNEVKSNEGKYYTCSSDIDVAISEKGINYISVSKSNQCYVESNGYSYCFGK